MPKIIIVEDDPMISDIYEKKFTEAGYEVLTANAGDQVLTLAKKGGVDMILLDLVIPRMSGFDVIKNLRTRDYDPNIKIVVFSNLSQPDDRKRALELGASGYITKSDYTPSSLVKEINRLLNQYQQEKRNESVANDDTEKTLPSSRREGGKKRILMMEDEEVFREMFGEKLKQDGYEVDFAENGSSGVKMALAGDYDLFIIDMIMPAMTGEEIVGKLKMEEKTQKVPIIVLSASVDEASQKGMEAMGIEAFYTKTQIIPSDLSKRIEEILK